MDRLEQLRRLTGHVEQAGNRALNVERTRSEAERELAAAQMNLRALHEELTNPSERYDPAAHGDSSSEIDGTSNLAQRPWQVAPEPKPRRKSSAARVALLLMAGAGVAGVALAATNYSNPGGSNASVAQILPHSAPDRVAGGQSASGAAAAANPSTSVAGKPAAAPSGKTAAAAAVKETAPAPFDVAVAAAALDKRAKSPVATMSNPPEIASAAISSNTAASVGTTDATSSTTQVAAASIDSASGQLDKPAMSSSPGSASGGALPLGDFVPTEAKAGRPELIAPYAQRFVGISANERECLARAVYYEARGESVAGQIAVAQVVLNRSMSSNWPNSICAVVYQGEERGEKCQFSFACMKRSLSAPHGEPWQQATWVTNEVLSGGAWLRELLPATHYHRTDLAPVWRLALKEIGRIGSHIFYGPPGTTELLTLEVAGDGGAPVRVAAKAKSSGLAKRYVPRTTAADKAAGSNNDWAKRTLGQ